MDIKLYDHIVQQIGQQIHQYGPAAWNMVIGVKRLDAIASLADAFIWLVLAIVVAVVATKLSIPAFKKSHAVDAGEAIPWILACVVLWLFDLAAIDVAVVNLSALFDAWTWIAVFNPQLAVVHDIINAALQHVQH